MRGDTSLINLLNEVMARRMKAKLSSFVQSPADNVKSIGISFLQKLFDINKNNCPKPNEDVMVSEPSLTSVRESCQHWATIVNRDELKKFRIEEDIDVYVNKILLPYLQTFHFSLSVQRYLQERKISWDNLIEKIEDTGRIPEDMTNFMAKRMQGIDDIYSYFDLEDKKDIHLYAQNVWMQAILYSDSQSRVNINQKNVFDSQTFQEMIIDLRMAIYFDACKVKKDKWLSIIGDVTYEAAYNSDETVYDQLIGVHTDGHSKKYFWALARAAKGNQNKMDIFLKRSSSTAVRCFEKIK